MLAAPAVLVVLGAATATLGPIVGGVVLFGLGAIGGAVIAIGLWLAIRILSLRLLVEPDYLHLRGVGTDRRYHLVRGDMSRLATAGPRKVNLRVRLGSLGWAVGRTALAAGDTELAKRLVEGLEPRYPLDEHALCASRAQLAEHAGEQSEAAKLYAEAAERWEEFGNVPERAYALLARNGFDPEICARLARGVGETEA